MILNFEEFTNAEVVLPLSQEEAHSLALILDTPDARMSEGARERIREALKEAGATQKREQDWEQLRRAVRAVEAFLNDPQDYDVHSVGDLIVALLHLAHYEHLTTAARPSNATAATIVGALVTKTHKTYIEERQDGFDYSAESRNIYEI